MDMWIELHPDALTKPMFYDAILNGLEVFKMSMAENNLAGLNPVPIANHTVDPSQAYGKMHHDSKRNVVAIIGGVASSVLLLFLLGGCICLFVIYKSQKKKERESEEEKRSDGTSNSTTADSSNSFISASVATFHDAR
ncbi:receptor-like protein kinase FERONIA [Carex littledalei]|uniref:Receptor-like protein kinase FERONIA n=1 Tax=Carex littledalei TaxID=544730 RepID=A0A833QYN2_9POAL|nr:receptor-like protein kinase FERONIA [Carex littledalei]